MKNEWGFRVTAAVLLASAMSVSGYHRHKAEKAGGDRSPAWREEGLPVAIGLRLSGVVLLLSVVAWMLDPRWTRRSKLALPAPVRWSGAGIGAASLPLEYWVLRSIGNNITPTVGMREDHKLVTDGPYRWVRHPLYSVGVSHVVALNLLVANWFTVLASLTGLLMLLVRLPKEEAKLVERFGDEYRAYTRRTGRFLPSLW